ncbi:MAG: UDP-glucose/GDP-mannose dehydrogenase family protein [Planctomycetes bacterium]|nr:UDP-glucose/GDP-mannose dehydrogenase family protein [Planctomycetota bacterium]MBL7143746.1 UDP-glucose/GDP-mannose dehydrogenase family protein [Phycisphaerae bacterium]
MQICVVGIGYVGLVTAACLAEAGNTVVCVDNDSEKIARLKDGVIPIYEAGLAEIVKRNEKLGRLDFTTDLKYGIDNSLIIFLAVGTPSAEDGSADISAILSVVADIAENMSDYRIIATKSTVPVGTHQKVMDIIKSKTNTPFDYVSNPEFLKEGAAVEDFMSPDRIIVGTNNPEIHKTMKQLYSPFMRKSSRILFMDPVSAEMAKYAANTMLATRISFMNEISVLCERLGADIEQVRRGLGSDSRIGSAFLFPGVGFGGSCFPKDIRALIHTGDANGIEMTIARSVQQVNLNQQERFAKRITDYFAGRYEQTTLAVWGLAFKAKTNDVRESPAIHCIKKFLGCNIKIRAYDPEAASAAKTALDGKIETFDKGYDALENADALVIFTDWQEFRNPNFELIATKLKKAVIFDGRNLYDPKVVKTAGFEYYSIGRATILS